MVLLSNVLVVGSLGMAEKDKQPEGQMALALNRFKAGSSTFQSLIEDLAAAVEKEREELRKVGAKQGASLVNSVMGLGLLHLAAQPRHSCIIPCTALPCVRGASWHVQLGGERPQAVPALRQLAVQVPLKFWPHASHITHHRPGMHWRWSGSSSWRRPAGCSRS